MLVSGDVREGSEFQLTSRPGNMADASFIAIAGDGVRVTRRLTDLFDLGDDCPVIANWHGQRRTDAFSTTVGHLKRLAAEYVG
jgi:hypothetical protein